MHKKISFVDFEWIQKDVTMHPPVNVLVNFNDFIQKKASLKCDTNNNHIKEFPISPSHIGIKHLQNIHNQ
jgi:hypothetical protein